MITRLLTALLALTLIGMTAGTAFAESKTEKKRQEILEMRHSVLTELFEARPQAKAEIDDAEGYAVFSNVGVQVLLLGAGGGRGVVRDNDSGQDTFMKMGTVGVGLGLGIKDFRAVFIFHDREALKSFIEKGWDFSGEADAAARAGDKGGEIGEAGSVRKKVSVYQFTKNGLALQASLHGTKYWQDKKLNK